VKEVIMDDVEPNRDTKEPRLVITFGGTIARGVIDMDTIERAVIIIPRSVTLAILGVIQFRIQMPSQPDEPLERRVEPIQKKVGCPDDE
jgi:hypothetical protein